MINENVTLEITYQKIIPEKNKINEAEIFYIGGHTKQS